MDKETKRKEKVKGERRRRGSGGGEGNVSCLISIESRRWETGRRRRNACVSALKLWMQQVSPTVKLSSLAGVTGVWWFMGGDECEGIGWHPHPQTPISHLRSW